MVFANSYVKFFKNGHNWLGVRVIQQHVGHGPKTLSRIFGKNKKCKYFARSHKLPRGAQIKTKKS